MSREMSRGVGETLTPERGVQRKTAGRQLMAAAHPCFASPHQEVMRCRYLAKPRPIFLSVSLICLRYTVDTCNLARLI